MTAAQFKRQQLEKFRNAYKKAKENGTTKAIQQLDFQYEKAACRTSYKRVFYGRNLYPVVI